MKRDFTEFLKTLGIYILALLIPGLLVATTLQARHYETIEREVKNLEKMQTELIESNKAYVTEISQLSNSQRIEDIATEKLGMRKAQTEDIVRVAIKGK